VKKKYSLLLFLVLLHIAFWVIKKPPQPSSDDLVYVENAKAMLAGEYHLVESPKSHRLVVIAPVALLINVFGESPWVISAWPLLCSCLTLVTLFAFLARHSGLTHAFAAGLLLATNTLQIDYSDSLFPDVIVAMFAFWFVMQIFLARLRAGHHWIQIIAAVVLFYTGYLAKEIIIFVLPFVFVQMIMDVKTKAHITFWKKFTAAIVLGAIAFVGVYYLLSGQLNFLYDTVQTRHSEFYALDSFRKIVRRITYGPAMMIGENVGYIVLFLLAIHFVMTGAWRKQDGANKTIRFFLLYFVVLLLTYWFAPISLSQFSFIHLDPRMWMMLLVPLYIIGGYTISKIAEGENDYGVKVLAIVFLVLAALTLIFDTPQRAVMFMMFSLSAVIIRVLQKRMTLDKMWVVFILLAPAIILALRFTTANSNFLISQY
jgi:hypothetical protein